MGIFGFIWDGELVLVFLVFVFVGVVLDLDVVEVGLFFVVVLGVVLVLVFILIVEFSFGIVCSWCWMVDIWVFKLFLRFLIDRENWLIVLIIFFSFFFICLLRLLSCFDNNFIFIFVELDVVFLVVEFVIFFINVFILLWIEFFRVCNYFFELFNLSNINVLFL